MSNFTEEQIRRYSRHIILPEVGGKGQKKILEAKVLIIGAGGLGSPIGLYLAAAGIGRIGIIDGDVVDLSNLQRQVFHHTTDLGVPKVESAKAKMIAINPDIEVTTYNERLSSKNIMAIFSEYDIIADGTDNFPTKFLINDAAVFANKPLVHGGILRFDGQVMTIIPNQSTCYRCIFHNPPPAGLVPSCQEAGVLGALAGVIGTIQATEVLKLAVGKGRLLSNRLLTYNALRSKFREVKLHRNPKCAVCGEKPTIKELIDYEQPVCAI